MKHEPIDPSEAAVPGDAMQQPDGRAVSSLPGRDERRPLFFNGHLLRGTGEIVDVEVADLSYDGCKIRTPKYLWPKETLKLSVPGRGVIEAEVRWCTDGFAGLRFEPEEEPRKTLVERVEDRFATSGEVTIKRLGAPSFRVDVRDVSRFGCKIDLVERPRIGELVLIRFDGIEPLEARIRWVEGHTGGAEYERPIHAAVFDILRDRLN